MHDVSEAEDSTTVAPQVPTDPAQESDSSSCLTTDGTTRIALPVSELAAHPGNVREDLALTPEFCASIANCGVRVPLLVTRMDDGTYRVIEGHRRLAAAVKAGLETVPCDVDPSRGEDEAGQYLDMLLANSDAYRRNFAAVEEAAALFAAHEAGASRTRLRKATGRKAEEIKTALKAARISPQTRDAAGDLARQLSLDDLALLAEFNDDPGAISRILDAIHRGDNPEYVAERIRQDRAEATEHQQRLDELRAADTPITDTLPAGAVRLADLLHDGGDLTVEAHASCPGRGAYFYPFNLAQPIHYCTNPEKYGHTGVRMLVRPIPSNADSSEGTGDGPAAGSSSISSAEETALHTRRLVIEGNKAWQAAAEVRRRWLANVLFARRNAPREVAQFVARQLLTMAEPLRTSLTSAPGRESFTEITRQNAGQWLEICDTTTAARLPLLMLAPIATTYEQAMTEGLGRATWRTDNIYSPCPRAEAGRYLSFLASLGYKLAPIEQAVADDVPYTGDKPEDQLPGGDPVPGETPDSTSGQKAHTADADEQVGHAGEANSEESAGISDQAAA